MATLPKLMSVNQAYRSFYSPKTKRLATLKSKSYRQWLANSLVHLHAQHKQSPTSATVFPNQQLKVVIASNAPRQDIDNCVKTLLDLMEQAKVYTNDKQVRWLEVFPSADKMAHIRVEVINSGALEKARELFGG